MITFPELGQAGRLGNQLWQIASTIGIAESRGEKFSFPRWDYMQFFMMPEMFFSDQPGTPSYTLVNHIDERARLYLQDYNLFKHITPEIWQLLQPSPQADATLEHEKYQWYLELAAEHSVISVHVRRGDNAYDPGTPDKHLYHPLRSATYYREAIKLVPPDEPVVVFSDDLPWCRENMPDILGRDCYFFEGGIPRPKEHEPEYHTAPVADWIDLVAMTLADHHIISNSTYAWWGAFLSRNGKPIYPTNWFGPALSHINTELMFPNRWRAVHDPLKGT